MPAIEIVKTGLIDRRESAFPQAVQLPTGDVLCSFSAGGGAEVTGGTDWARSTDGGETWTVEGTILAADAANGLANFLKLSLSADGKTVYAYGAEIDHDISKPFGARAAHAVLCRSTDHGKHWSAPVPVPMGVDCGLEISCAAVPLRSGRLLAPAATLADSATLGEHVIVAISDDGGASWPRHATVFRDRQARRGFFEHKFSVLPSGRVMATAWTVTLGDYRDLPNHFSISKDDGATWGPARSTGIEGQTMSTLALGSDRLLVLYNRRYGAQAVVGCLVTFTEEKWTVRAEHILYDAQAVRRRAASVCSGIDELNDFAFGFPTAIKLADGSILATYWCVENGTCGVRWTKLTVDW